MIDTPDGTKVCPSCGRPPRVLWIARPADVWLCYHDDGTRHPRSAPCAAVGGEAVKVYDGIDPNDI